MINFKVLPIFLLCFIFLVSCYQGPQAPTTQNNPQENKKVYPSIKSYKILVFADESTKEVINLFLGRFDLEAKNVKKVVFLTEPKKEKEFKEYNVNKLPTFILVDTTQNKVLINTQQANDIFNFLNKQTKE